MFIRWKHCLNQRCTYFNRNLAFYVYLISKEEIATTTKKESTHEGFSSQMMGRSKFSSFRWACVCLYVSKSAIERNIVRRTRIRFYFYFFPFFLARPISSVIPYRFVNRSILLLQCDCIHSCTQCSFRLFLSFSFMHAIIYAHKNFRWISGISHTHAHTYHTKNYLGIWYGAARYALIECYIKTRENEREKEKEMHGLYLRLVNIGAQFYDIAKLI